MIDGKVIDHPILNKLKESKQEFILTGSRRYEGASTGDWDRSEERRVGKECRL